MYDSPKFLTAGDRALVVEIGEVISPECNRRVNQLLGAIEEGGVRGVVDLVPTYRSLMVQYDPMLVSFEELRGAISEVGSKLKDGKAGAGGWWRYRRCTAASMAPTWSSLRSRRGYPSRMSCNSIRAWTTSCT